MKYNDNNIVFNNVPEPFINAGARIKNGKYVIENGVIKSSNKIINAIDIDWNEAQLPNRDTVVKSTADVLALLDSGSGSVTIDNAVGVPLYTPKHIENLGDNIPEEYVSIPSVEELKTITKDPVQYEYRSNSSYLNILFSAIRSLQSEVAMLRNAFRYGINSYNDEHTAFSSVEAEDPILPDEEPLWAVDEGELSQIDGFSCPIGETHTLNGDTEFAEDAIVCHDACWVDEYYKEGSSHDEGVALVDDTKLFIYITTNSKGIKFTLVDKNDESNVKEIDLSLLNIPEAVNGKYNILMIINRPYNIAEDDDEEPEYVGENFVWISVGSYVTGDTIYEGYIDDSNNISDLKVSLYDKNASLTVQRIDFTDTSIYKFMMYSRYQDFSSSVLPSKPTDDEYKYNVAHITIRSVESLDILEKISEQLQKNELVFVESEQSLYIKNKENKIINIGAGSGMNPDEPTDELTMAEIKEALQEAGIISNENGNLELNPIASLTFINESTKSRYIYEVDSDGELKKTEINDMESIIDATKAVTKRTDISNGMVTDGTWFPRTIVSQTWGCQYSSNPNFTADMKLNADRVRIGAIYAPLDTDIVHGCSHAYVELENSSEHDWNLENCYLHFAKKENDEWKTYHLKLDGKIPGGGTYLVRGKRYGDRSDANTFIHVDTFDKEWYDENGELLDFTMKDERSLGNDNKQSSYTFMLTYGYADAKYDEKFVEENNDDKTYQILGEQTKFTKAVFGYNFLLGFIDSASINSNNVKWCPIVCWNQEHNSIYKNTFELDPAKQAYNSISTKDSSRTRWGNPTTDNQILQLDNEYIQFKKSDEKFKISNYTPKASFEHKNVCTDKSKLDTMKPNMVTCSFGVDGYRTRCFNWISVGIFDEYVFIKNDDNTWDKFESYKKIDVPLVESTSYPHRKEFPVDVNNIVYADTVSPRFVGRFPADNTFYTAHKCIIDVVENPVTVKKTFTYIVGRADANGNPDFEHCSEEYTFTLYPTSYVPRIYQTTDQQGFHWIEYQAWAMAANKLNDVILDDMSKSDIIPVLVNTGDMTQSGARINEWLDYYNAGKRLFKHLEQMNCVGNNDLCGTDVNALGTGDDEGKSNSFFFHIFYCYEVSPIYLDADKDTKANPIYPIVNNKYIPSFYQFRFDSNDTPYKFIFLNSEITKINCSDWYGLNTSARTINGTQHSAHAVNIYTGFEIGAVNETNHERYVANELGFTPIYTMLYHIMDDANTVNTLLFCHEMPFTVITNACIRNDSQNTSTRSWSDADALVGSHCNLIDKSDYAKNAEQDIYRTVSGAYWLSRLLEYRNIKLCIGGHKHTYMMTWPTAENYLWKERNEGEDEWKSSFENKAPMKETLAYEAKYDIEGFVNEQIDIKWTNELTEINTDGENIGTQLYNTSKTPYVTISNNEIELYTNRNRSLKEEYNGLVLDLADPTHFYPCTLVIEKNGEDYIVKDVGGVIYLMCQATGYKQTSNKELPTAFQRFSYLIPKTTVPASTGKDTADDEQKHPMYVVLELSKEDINIKLVRVNNIMNSGKFTQLNQNAGLPKPEYATHKQINSGEVVKDAQMAVWKDNAEYLYKNLKWR